MQSPTFTTSESTDYHKSAEYMRTPAVPPSTPTMSVKLTKLTRTQMLHEELNLSKQVISELTREIDSSEMCTAEKLAKQENAIDMMDRAISMRQMHLETLLEEKEDLEADKKSMEGRIKNIRNKALQRKFQSRFWMVMFGLSLTEHIVPGTLPMIAETFIIPVTIGLVTGDTMANKVMRSALVVLCAGYFRIDNVLRAVPSLV